MRSEDTLEDWWALADMLIERDEGEEIRSGGWGTISIRAKMVDLWVPQAESRTRQA